MAFIIQRVFQTLIELAGQGYEGGGGIRAVLIVGRVAVLLEEVFFYEGGDVEGNLVVVGEGGLADELDYLVEFLTVGEAIHC